MTRSSSCVKLFKGETQCDSIHSTLLFNITECCQEEKEQENLSTFSTQNIAFEMHDTLAQPTANTN